MRASLRIGSIFCIALLAVEARAADRDARGDGTTYVLPVPLIQTAIAEAGMGDRRAAVWHWQMAQTLDPAAAGVDLSPFGEAGAFLQQHRLSNPAPEKCNHDHPEGLVTPNAVMHPSPRYPEGARQARESGIVIIDLTIGADGAPREARLVKRLAPSLDYAALEVIRNWTFTPAQRDGKPVETTFCLTINFKLD